MLAESFSGYQAALLVQRQGDGGDFQQCIGAGFEAAGLHIHHHGQIAAETLGNFGVVGVAVHGRAA